MRMRDARGLVVVLVLGCHAERPPSTPSHTPVSTAYVVRTHPHSPEAFTEGLELWGGRLYESAGLRGRSSLRMVDLETGIVGPRRMLADDLYAEGLTILDGRIYQVTYQTHRCLIYDAATLAPLGERTYEGEAWGLTHEGGLLLLSDGTNVLRWLDPETLEVRRTLAVLDEGTPVERLNELEMVEGELFANVWMSDRIARIDRTTGHVIGWIDLTFLREGLRLTEPQAVLNGIAYDATTHQLFVTGKLWPELYEIRIGNENAQSG